MKVVFTAVIIALAALVIWLGFSSEEPRAQVVVIANPWHTASAVQSNQQAEQEKFASIVAQSASSGELSASGLHPEKLCEPSKAAEAFGGRRNKILTAFHEEINRPRKEQGLELLDWPKVEPTPEEKAAIIREFQARVQKFDPENPCLGPGNMHDDILNILSDIEDAGIKASDLGAESFQKLKSLGQEEADSQAKYVEELLERGCFGTAGYIMGTYVNKIAEVLDDPSFMGYIHLNGRIVALHAMERRDARASTEEATDEVVRNLSRQRANSLPGCGMG